MESCCDKKKYNIIQIITFVLIVESFMDINLFMKFLIMKMKII